MSAICEKLAGGKKVDMKRLPEPGEIYKHFKGNCYRIITVATHTETGEKLVIYQALYGDYGVYARELSMFLEPVDKEKYPYATQNRRFELVESKAVSLIDSEGDKSVAKDIEEKTAHAPDKERFPEKESEPEINPMVLAYLDAGTCKEKLQILTTMKDYLTDEMINTMAIAIDVEVREGDITERYEELKYCLVTRKRFESRRLR